MGIISKDTSVLLVLTQFTLLFWHLFMVSCEVYIENNAYKDVVVSFSPSVKPGDVDIEKLKSVLSASSKFLFEATKRRAYFSEFVLAIPSSWPRSTCEESDRMTSPPNNIDIYVTDTGHNVKPISAQHSQACGKQGDVIYMPISWLRGDTEALTSKFVQQWAIYRYGVFEETSVTPGGCFMNDIDKWSPIGCYNTPANLEEDIDENGLPVCGFDDDMNLLENMTSSIMFSTNSSNVTNFCDGSKAFPHNPFILTKHNVLCGGRPTWKVIENHEDFKFGVNPPMSDDLFQAQVTIKCFQEDDDTRIFFAIQNSSILDITQIVTQLRFSLLRFYLYDAPSTKSTIQVFSNSTQTEQVDPIDLDLSKPQEVASSLTEYVRVAEQVESVCLTCPVQKLLEANGRGEMSSNAIVVFVILSSALNTTNSIEFAEELQKLKQKVHLLVVQDSTGVVIATPLASVIFRSGGQILDLPSNPVELTTKANVVLLSLLKGYKLEDRVIVVHQATYSNVKSDIVDRFALDDGLFGQLTYTLQCDHSDMINVQDLKCLSLKNIPSGAYQCGMSIYTSEANALWEFNFKYLKGIPRLTCSALATVTLSTSQKTKIMFRGWLSHNIVKPGRDALVIYSEFLKNYIVTTNVEVEAHIYRPTESEPFILQLRDNGNGDPDVEKGDGIYSRYFTNFTTKGIYSVAVQMRILKEGNDSSTKDHQVGQLSQITIIGSFILETEPPVVDIYPPNRIADLRVTSVNHKENKVILQWTAPGDNYDYGQANQYEIKYARTWSSLLDISFESLSTSLLSIGLEEILPLDSGNIQNEAFQLPPVNAEVYYIAMRTFDKSLQSSSASNIVQLYMRNEIQSTEIQTETQPSVDAQETTSTTIISEENSTSATNETSSEISISTVSPGNLCRDINHLIMIAAIVGGCILLLVILINILICWCFRKRSQQETSKQGDLRPPYNMTLAYKTNSSEIEVSTTNVNDVNGSHETLNDDNRYQTISPPSTEPFHHSPQSNTPKELFDDYEDFSNFQTVRAMPAHVNSICNSQEQLVVTLNRSGDTNAQIEPSESEDKLQMYTLGLV